MRRSLLIGIICALLLTTVLGGGRAFCQQQNAPTQGTVLIKTLTLASTEYSIDLGAGIKAFSVQLRGDYNLRIGFFAGSTSTAYWTIPSAGPPYVSPPCYTSLVLYLRCDGAAGQVAEIEYWR